MNRWSQQWRLLHRAAIQWMARQGHQPGAGITPRVLRASLPALASLSVRRLGFARMVSGCDAADRQFAGLERSLVTNDVEG